MTERERENAEIDRLKGVVASIKADMSESVLESVWSLRRNEWNLAYLEGRKFGYDLAVRAR